MKKTWIGALVFSLLTGGAWAVDDASADDVSLQLRWVTQAQFAGYYVALDKGFYDQEGLNVTIAPGGPGIVPTQVIADGGADVIVEWMPTALVAREQGLPLVNIAQPFKNAGLMLTCWKDSGIAQPADLVGHTLAVWFAGSQFPFMSWMSQLGISTDGQSENGVEVLKQGLTIDPFLQRQADCISTMTYNEYGQVIDAGVDPDELMTFNYQDQGVATLEDGLYVLEDNLADMQFVDKMERFVRASMKGWQYAQNHPDEAVEIMLRNVGAQTDTQTQQHQKRMMGAITKLIAGSNGTLDPADYQHTVDTLMVGDSPVITAEPQGAWTHMITDQALNRGH